MWKTVEAETRKIGVAKTERRRKERGRGKEMRRKGEKKRKEKT